jgi:hypothetical protein
MGALAEARDGDAGRFVHRHGPRETTEEVAHDLDVRLRGLSGQEAHCRVLLGRLAGPFLRDRAHRALGFARLNDYTRERLGCSAREVQSLGRVAERLQTLPLIAAAFARGELCWTRLRDLVEVAKPADEEGWLALIRGPGARIAEVAARRRRRARGEDDHQTIDDEPAVTVRLECPRRIRAQWRRVVELARRVCGSDIPMWQVADAVAGEGFSSRSIEPEEPVAAASPADDEWQIRASPPPLGPTGLPDDATLPDDLRRLGEGCERLDGFTLDHRLRLVVRALQRIDWETGRLLRQLSARGLYRRLGYPALHHYVASRLAISPRKARALISIECRSREAPVLAAAYRDGVLSWLRVLTLLPVAREEVAEAWVARARTVTLRRLADEVDWALAKRDCGLPGIEILPPPLDAALVRPEWQIRARDGQEVADVAIVFPAPASVAVLLREAIAAFTERGDPPWAGVERLLTHAETTWTALPRHRDPIFERDGWRCAVPACSARRELQDHHVVFRSQGGDNGRDNRITVCAAHHLHGIHQGRIRARGRAPDALVWELGVRPGRPPLLRLQGDRYLD